MSSVRRSRVELAKDRLRSAKLLDSQLPAVVHFPWEASRMHPREAIGEASYGDLASLIIERIAEERARGRVIRRENIRLELERRVRPFLLRKLSPLALTYLIERWADAYCRRVGRPEAEPVSSSQTCLEG